jgi:transposase-like protein
MVSRAKSDRVKGHEKSHQKEFDMAAAVREYHLEQAKPAALGQKKSVCAIAERHGVSYSTLNQCVQGGQSIIEANQEKQKVTPIQEWLLVQFMRESAE